MFHEKGKEECNMKKEIFESPVAEVTKFEEVEITLNSLSTPEIGW